MGRAFHKPDAAHADQSAWDRLLEKHPPEITWVKTRGGVWVAEKVTDPHAELNGAPRRLCKRRHEMTPENTAVMPDGTQRCRACRRLIAHEAYLQRKAECTNENLLAAARTQI